MNKLIQYISLCVIILLCSCDKNECRHDVGVPVSGVNILTKRLDLKLFGSTDIDKFKKEEPRYISFIESTLIPVDMTDKFLKYAGSSSKIKELRDSSIADFEDNELLEQELEDMYGRLKVYYPSFEVPEIDYVFSAFGGVHILENKGIVYIGTDYFIENKEKFPIPSDYFPQYIAAYMTKKYIPAKLGMLHSNHFNNLDLKDRTLLNEIIAYGKTFYFVGQLLPCSSTGHLMSRSDEDIENFEAHKKDIWNHFVKNQLFFKEDTDTKRRYIEPRPKTVEIADQCPGMVGQWFGYEIVKAFMKNNDVSLIELMAMTDAKNIFNKSGLKSEMK